MGARVRAGLACLCVRCAPTPARHWADVQCVVVTSYSLSCPCCTHSTFSHLVKKKSLKTKKFQRGVELCKISSEVCEGFLNLVVPKLRARQDIVVETYVRQEPTQTMDLRLLVRLKSEVEQGNTGDLERAGLNNAPIASAVAPMILPLPMFGAVRIDAALTKARTMGAS